MVLFDKKEKRIFDGTIKSKNKTEENQTDFEYFKSNPTIGHIYEDNDLFFRCWEYYRYISNTEPDCSENGIESWFKHEEDVNTVTICSKTLIKSSIMKVLAVLAEIDLMNKFVDKFEEIKKIKELSLFRWLVQIRIKMPFTISNREVIAVGFGTTIPENKSILLPFKSVEDTYLGVKIPDESSDYKRIKINFGYYTIKYIDENHCELTNCYNVDPRVPLVPMFILNGFIKKLSYYVMKDFKTQLEKDNTALYNERMENNKEFYDKIWNSIRDVCDK